MPPKDYICCPKCGAYQTKYNYTCKYPHCDTPLNSKIIIERVK